MQAVHKVLHVFSYLRIPEDSLTNCKTLSYFRMVEMQKQKCLQTNEMQIYHNIHLSIYIYIVLNLINYLKCCPVKLED